MTRAGNNQRPVPVVRLIIENGQGDVLLLRRQENSTSGGGWCLPGGKIDYGDTVEKTVIKELAEETGLVCMAARFLFCQDSTPANSGEMHCINLYFRCEVRGEIRLNDESTAYVWVGPEEIGKYALVFRNGEGLARYWGDDSESRS